MKSIKIFAIISLLLVVTEARSDWRGFITLTTDSTGLIDIPVESGDSFWVILNECYLDRFGFTKSGQSIKYRPQNYGDIFFFQQFSGSSAKFVQHVVHLKIARSGACATSQAGIETLQEKLGGIGSFTIAQEIMDVYDIVKQFDPGLTPGAVIGRFPNTPGKTCPSDLKSDQDRQDLADCLDVNTVIEASKDTLAKLHTFPSPRISTDFTPRNYQIRKPFSASTIKSSLAFVNTENTAVNTVYVSINPFVVLLKREGWTKWIDPITVDIGLAKPTGNTASERFKSADNHYMFGIGYELTDTFSFHISHIYSYHQDGNTEGNTAFGVSIDLLSLASKFK